MTCVLVSSAVDMFSSPGGVKPRIIYKIGICCFSAKHAALRSQNKDWLGRDHNDVSAWGDMSSLGL